MRFLLDSTIIIDALNGIDKAKAFLRENAADSSISVITVNEVLAGSPPSRLSDHELLLDQFECFGVDIFTAKTSAALRRQHRWKLADSIQAALALNRGIQLVTRNHRDFNPTRHVFVLVPYRLN